MSATWDENTIRRTRFDYPLLVGVIALTCLGLIMVFSSSAVLAQERFGDGLYFLKKMMIYAVLGFGLLYGMMRVPYYHWRKWVYPFLFLSLLAALLTVFSGLGVKISGAKRWLALGPVTFQPSELAKLSVILFMAYSIEKKNEKMERFGVGILPNLVIPGILIFFVLMGKDLGTSFVMVLLILTMLFLGGAKPKHLAFLSLGAVPIFYHLITQEGYRMRRILSFLNPWNDRYGSGFQVIQSFLAFNEGGFLGKGLGAGQQKLFYLPEAHTDFIFSVLGEELGLVGVMATTAAFLFICYRGLKIASKAPDLFGRYLVLGVVVLVGTQSILNMGVVMGLLPTKGLVLPFVSYGGSSLLTLLAAMGIVLNVSTYQQTDTPPMFEKKCRSL
ncbi:MAG: putative lipid II flippase FtsW [Deltaproteobacteria bacterium]|nr:putative lipid II flippase FtsW [Deltaproteobacteria bacterium]MDZ4224331.1 putative lipid II flippase FtsW [bacterium]